jgi:dienelactone hydrolase
MSYIKQGRKVILFGQSMGASTVIAVGAELSDVTAVVAWVPDANVDYMDIPESGYFEEDGQLVQMEFWTESQDAKIGDKLKTMKAPAYIVQCSKDEYVSTDNHMAIIDNVQTNHKLEMFQDYSHSSWSYEQATDIIDKSVQFVLQYTSSI